VGGLTVTLYQPVAGLLGHPQPGGWKLELAVEGEAALGSALAAAGYAELATSLATIEVARYYVVAVNGRADPTRLQAIVRGGDNVSILPVYVGG
jgi:hypothetical protein